MLSAVVTGVAMTLVIGRFAAGVVPVAAEALERLEGGVRIGDVTAGELLGGVPSFAIARVKGGV